MNSHEAALLKSYLWCRIIDIGFSPCGDREILQWLTIYQRSLVLSWGLPMLQPNLVRLGRRSHTGFSHEFDCMNIALSLSHKGDEGFDIVLKKMNGQSHIEIQHHADTAYFTLPMQLMSRQYGMTSQRMQALCVRMVVLFLFRHEGGFRENTLIEGKEDFS